MSPRNRIIALLIINILCFRFGGYWIGVISCFISLYRLLGIYGFTKKVQLFQNHFRPGICYIKDAVDLTTNFNKLFNDISNIINEKNLNDFSIIVFYYDKFGAVNENEQRFSIGIYKKCKGDYIIKEEINEFLVKEGFRRQDLVDAKSLYCSWDYYIGINIKIGRSKFYRLIKDKIKSEKFMKAFGIDKNQIKVAVEVYDKFFGNKCLYFYIPFENVDKFILDQKNK